MSEPLELKMGDLIRFKKDTPEFANFKDAQFTVVALGKVNGDHTLVKVRHIKADEESSTFWANISAVESVVAAISLALPNDALDWVKGQANASGESLADIIVKIIRSDKNRAIRKAKKQAGKQTFTRAEYNAAVEKAYSQGQDSPRTRDGW